MLYEENYRELPPLEKRRSKDVLYHQETPRTGICLPTIHVDETIRKQRAKDMSPPSRGSLPFINPRGSQNQKRNRRPKQPIQCRTKEVGRDAWKASTDNFLKENIPESRSRRIFSEPKDDGERAHYWTPKSFDSRGCFDNSHVSGSKVEPKSRRIIREPQGVPTSTAAFRGHVESSESSASKRFDLNDENIPEATSGRTSSKPEDAMEKMTSGSPRRSFNLVSSYDKNTPEPTSGQQLISEPKDDRESVRCSTHGAFDLNACYDGSHASNLLSWIRGTYVAIANARSEVMELEDPQESMHVYYNIALQWIRMLNMWSTGQIGVQNYDKILKIERPCIQMPSHIYDLYRAMVDASQGEVGGAELTLAAACCTILGKWVMQCIRITGVSCMA